MKLRNKKTGEIGELHFEPDKEYHFTVATEDPADMRIYKTLTDLNEEWEDYEEPREFYIVGHRGRIDSRYRTNDEYEEPFKEIGNYFETEEEAEKAVEKLKAWKRLKDKRFDKVFNLELSDALCGGKTVEFKLLIDDKDLIEDIKLLFGGEE